MDLQTFLQSEPRGTAARIARELQVHPVMVSQWAAGLKPVPAERCAQLELATRGQVTRRQLRPNDWWLIWPELVTDEYPVPIFALQA